MAAAEQRRVCPDVPWLVACGTHGARPHCFPTLPRLPIEHLRHVTGRRGGFVRGVGEWGSRPRFGPSFALRISRRSRRVGRPLSLWHLAAGG